MHYWGDICEENMLQFCKNRAKYFDSQSIHSHYVKLRWLINAKLLCIDNHTANCIVSHTCVKQGASQYKDVVLPV